MLETSNLTKKFGGLAALDRVNFNVNTGELRGVIGPNGSGKTTLVNIITGYLPPTEGKVLFKGEDITSLPPQVIARKGIGRNFQLTNVFPKLTVLENLWVASQVRSESHSNPLVHFRNLKDVEKRVEDILGIVGLGPKANELAFNCSYGEQRLLEIGVVLGINPDLMILDEPTAGLSPGEREKILDVIKELSKSKTIIVIEHSMEVIARLASTVTVLDFGQIVAEGPPKDIIKNEKVQEIYLRGR